MKPRKPNTACQTVDRTLVAEETTDGDILQILKTIEDGGTDLKENEASTDLNSETRMAVGREMTQDQTTAESDTAQEVRAETA